MRYQDVTNFKNNCGYEINGIWYPRVTKILEIKSKPGLEVFFKEVDSHLEAESIKNKSAEEGSLIHGVIEKIALGEQVDVPLSIQAAASSFVRFKEETKIKFYPEFIERQIWSSRHRYAGTVDALASISGRFGVLDIKTSAGFYPEYNLQTAAYVSALQEFNLKRIFALPDDITTRWILRVDQYRSCLRCGASLREKGGRSKIRNGKTLQINACADGTHEWGEVKGEVEIKEFPFNIYRDIKAFIAAKILWEWENEYWLKQVGYLR